MATGGQCPYFGHSTEPPIAPTVCESSGVTGPRIEMLDDEAAKAAARLGGAPEYATVLNLNRILLHQPTQARDFVQYFWDLMYEGVLPPRRRELAIMRIAWLTASEYEWTQHWHLATGLGIPADHLVAVRAWTESSVFDDADRAMLAAADDIVERGVVRADTWAALQTALPDPAQQVEALLAITGWRMVASILRSLDVPLEPGIDPWPPDGVRPPSA